MRRLAVHYCGWGEDWPLGLLADDGTTLLFEYAPEALAQGLELSPLHLKLRAAAYGGFPPHLLRLPGLIADSLPDGWGLLLMDRLFRQQGLRHPGPLDRLAFIGDRAMGALRFVPAAEPDAEEPDWNLLALAKESERALAGEAGAALRELALTGGSPQGARPKALVKYDAESGHVSTRSDAPGSPWLVKFPAQGEHKEVCAIEQMYAELARDCGLEVPASAWFDLSSKLAAFGVARFDREQSLRVPVHSLAGLLQVDFRLPGSADYTALLRATRLLTRDEREVEKAYARAVFNVLFHNRDDHPKNFAWRLGGDRRWRLAPAFDLSFSEGPMGRHHMDVCGEDHAVERGHLLRLASEGGVAAKAAEATIDRMVTQAATFSQRAATYPIRRATVQQMKASIHNCHERLMHG
ncbi:type II toxin-antitoxin system HipA family toxin [Alicycliphilus denitrificans]|uniref:Type II toxin-antitoxin system HipA family toxin n=1 Tax=Alicycliphilus denitrificans TaxID=179636 RepID=A0A420KFF1_9BURK|nr:type II toxin-antitoxin system HipA family toxin [Alicycliphilus denitrificans]RKJ98674.1 type II toxin-antitoxin system HipA family toxin [Alicycliphilus denitrificans]